MLLATAIIWQCTSRYMYQYIYINSGELVAIPPTFITDTQTFLRAEAAILILFSSGLWSAKTSFLLFFRRLSENVSGQKTHWWIAFLLTLATYFVGVGMYQYRCLTPAYENIVIHCGTQEAVTYERVSLCIVTALDVLTDLISKYPSAITSPNYHLSNSFCSSLHPCSLAVEGIYWPAPETCLGRHILPCRDYNGNRHRPLCRRAAIIC